MMVFGSGCLIIIIITPIILKMYSKVFMTNRKKKMQKTSRCVWSEYQEMSDWKLFKKGEKARRSHTTRTSFRPRCDDAAGGLRCLKQFNLLCLAYNTHMTCLVRAFTVLASICIKSKVPSRGGGSASLH